MIGDGTHGVLLFCLVFAQCDRTRYNIYISQFVLCIAWISVVVTRYDLFHGLEIETDAEFWDFVELLLYITLISITKFLLKQGMFAIF